METTSTSQSGLSRRTAVGLGAAVATGLAATGTASAASTAPHLALEQAFRAAFTAPLTDPAALAAARLGLLLPEARIIDHDVPFALDKAGYADHLGFRLGLAERYEMKLEGVEVRLHGDSAIVSAYANERSKPRDAGFRLRPCFITAVCTQTTAGWQALSLHIGALNGQIIDASPG
jgi:hypothetical protein